ncbi:MAG: M24 family metallopeptidase [Proteobacteria bacterium]|nr:M24 family metallopeptidase [Pseudomonadota bacterium]
MLKLTPSVFEARRATLLDAMPDGSALLLPTNPERTRSNDTEYPFRPSSDFYYVTGYDEPEAWAVLKKNGTDKPYTLFVLPKDPEREVWTGIRHGPEGAVGTFGADQAFVTEEFDAKLGELLEDVTDLYFGFGRHPEVEPKVQEVLNRVRKGRKSGLGPATLRDSHDFLAEFRLRKTDDEVALMREGARLTHLAHVAAMEQVRPGMREYEIQALIEYTFRRNGAWGWAYQSIVAAGANACILHYVKNDVAFADGDLMLIDAGAEIDGYATDVTRTSPVSGTFTPPQRDLYNLVLASQIEAVDATVTGATIDGIHESVVKTLTQGMIDLGILTGSVDEAIETESFKKYYMHRTSHWLGMDVHDVGRYTLTSGDARPLGPGMVITIEPGLYIPPNDEDVPEQFRGLGIRIEDDVLVTEDGNENLTASIPKTIEDIEALRA